MVYFPKCKSLLIQTRVLSFRVASDKLEEVLDTYRNSFLEELENHQGFSGLVLIRDCRHGSDP